MRKTVLKFMITCMLSSLFSTLAFSFITVIDVEEHFGKVTTIIKADDYNYSKMRGKKISYRGNSSEAVSLFTSVVEAEFPGIVDFETEINPKTETISLIVKIYGFIGTEYYYWIITKSSD